MKTLRTESSTMAPDVLVHFTIVNHDVRRSDGSWLDEVNWIRAEVSICELLRAIPDSRVLPVATPISRQDQQTT